MLNRIKQIPASKIFVLLQILADFLKFFDSFSEREFINSLIKKNRRYSLQSKILVKLNKQNKLSK